MRVGKDVVHWCGELASTVSQMRDLAGRREWSHLPDLDARCERIIERLRGLGLRRPLRPVERATVEAFAARIQADREALTQLVRPQLAALLRQMQGLQGHAPPPAATARAASNEPAIEAPVVARPSDAAALSATGRAIGELAQAPAAPERTRPLLPEAPVRDPAAVARTLAAAVGHSGLFYESHLAAFAAGALPRDQLDREPQAAWRTEPAPAQPREAAAPGSELAPEAKALVAQQLQLLASGVFQWQGQAWPGAALEWELREDRSQPAPGENAAPRWLTTLRLTLPQLGAVEAHLTLHGPGLHAEVTADGDAAARLRARAGELAQALAAAGFAGAQVSVRERNPA